MAAGPRQCCSSCERAGRSDGRGEASRGEASRGEASGMDGLLLVVVVVRMANGVGGCRLSVELQYGMQGCVSSTGKGCGMH